MITSIKTDLATHRYKIHYPKENTIENVAKKGKQDKSVSEEKFDYSKYMFRPWTDNVKEFIDIDQSKEGWITDTINRLIICCLITP